VGWIDALRGTTVGLDTSPVIYFIEANPSYVGVIRPFFQAMDRGEFKVITSMVTLLEVLVIPFRRGDAVLAQRYRDLLLDSKGLISLPVTQNAAEEAAHLRAQHGLRTPDSLQMATALTAGAQVFLTNDARLPSLPTMQVLTLDSVRSAP
jgi:predicted nucleic acid-binding protein